mmetsp:Transcript_8818/g.14525  ORF Transcript_8818/g.14525 Transcript_8818/m.14525 type:complete len:102 (+) Transcript_8818:114-419(+)
MSKRSVSKLGIKNSLGRFSRRSLSKLGINIKLGYAALKGLLLFYEDTRSKSDHPSTTQWACFTMYEPMVNAGNMESVIAEQTEHTFAFIIYEPLEADAALT